ncbi:hypothetical protein Hypma_002136 [Hypsizygus marmoreus]|uniref:Uncharacterized protein n=1 Tax=Hypsizygus marmoreus TaxID=39966 RepID=A0A369JZR4_HYPMA|nr:hypothetical protein Hypma_002136 [Hypsizygus marmoreus]
MLTKGARAKVKSAFTNLETTQEESLQLVADTPTNAELLKTLTLRELKGYETTILDLKAEYERTTSINLVFTKNKLLAKIAETEEKIRSIRTRFTMESERLDSAVQRVQQSIASAKEILGRMPAHAADEGNAGAQGLHGHGGDRNIRGHFPSSLSSGFGYPKYGLADPIMSRSSLSREIGRTAPYAISEVDYSESARSRTSGSHESEYSAASTHWGIGSENSFGHGATAHKTGELHAAKAPDELRGSKGNPMYDNSKLARHNHKSSMASIMTHRSAPASMPRGSLGEPQASILTRSSSLPSHNTGYVPGYVAHSASHQQPPVSSAQPYTTLPQAGGYWGGPPQTGLSPTQAQQAQAQYYSGESAPSSLSASSFQGGPSGGWDGYATSDQYRQHVPQGGSAGPGFQGGATSMHQVPFLPPAQQDQTDHSAYPGYPGNAQAGPSRHWHGGHAH